MESSGSTYFLSKNEIQILKKNAVIDNEAAYTLYRYYTFSSLDSVKSLYWLKRSAKLGNKIAQYNYLIYLRDNKMMDEFNNLSVKWADNPEIKTITNPP